MRRTRLSVADKSHVASWHYMFKQLWVCVPAGKENTNLVLHAIKFLFSPPFECIIDRLTVVKHTNQAEQAIGVSKAFPAAVAICQNNEYTKIIVHIDAWAPAGMARQSWSWVTFSKPNPTQPKIYGPNPTQPTKVSTRPNPTHHRHLVWHIRLYRKLYTATVTRHRQVHSQWQLLFSCSTH